MVFQLGNGHDANQFEVSSSIGMFKQANAEVEHSGGGQEPRVRFCNLGSFLITVCLVEDTQAKNDR